MDSLTFRAVFALIMAAIMVAIVTFTLVLLQVGFSQYWYWHWLEHWLFAWPVAATSIFLLAPIVRTWTQRLLKLGSAPPEPHTAASRGAGNSQRSHRSEQ